MTRQVQSGDVQGAGGTRVSRIKGDVSESAIEIDMERGNLTEVRVSRRRTDRGRIVYLTVNKSTRVVVDGVER